MSGGATFELSSGVREALRGGTRSAKRNWNQAEHRVSLFGMNDTGPPLQPPIGGGTFDGMEARVAKLEAAVEHIQRDVGDIKSDVRTMRDHARADFRVLFGAT